MQNAIGKFVNRFSVVALFAKIDPKTAVLQLALILYTEILKVKMVRSFNFSLPGQAHLLNSLIIIK